MSRAPLLAIALLLAVGSSAEAQFGRGLQRYRAQGTKSYQFGYTPTFEIVVMNSALQDLEFRLAAFKNERQQWFAEDTAWVIEGGSFGTIGVMALDMRGYFLTRRGVRVPARVERGSYYALFYVDEETLREYERRDERGSIVIRTPEGYANPDVPEVRLTTLTDSTRRVRRAFDLLRTPYDRPGAKDEFQSFERNRFDEPDVAEGESEELDLGVDDQGGSTSGRIRQPGEELVTMTVLDAAGNPAAGARFVVRVGHGLAYRTETGNLDGRGVLRMFTTRDDSIGLDLTISDQVRGRADVTLDPSSARTFTVRLQ